MVRRLEVAGHVERTPNPAHLQGVLVRLVPHQLRDDQREVLRRGFRVGLRGAAGDAGLDRHRALSDVVLVLRAIEGCLHRAATDAATLRDARQTREGKRW
jgi:hypothetical protein